MSTLVIVQRHTKFSDHYATIEIDGVRHFVGVERGKRVKIPYKPRGQNIGYKWNGFVRDAKGRTLWSGYVPKGTGVIGLLRRLAAATEKSLRSE